MKTAIRYLHAIGIVTWATVRYDFGVINRRMMHDEIRRANRLLGPT